MIQFESRFTKCLVPNKLIAFGQEDCGQGFVISSYYRVLRPLEQEFMIQLRAVLEPLVQEINRRTFCKLDGLLCALLLSKGLLERVFIETLDLEQENMLRNQDAPLYEVEVWHVGFVMEHRGKLDFIDEYITMLDWIETINTEEY